MIIGIPKEIMEGEKRVSVIPETVEKLVKEGNKVLVEKGAGEGSHYLDSQYLQSGAEIISDVKDLYERSELILKVKEPQFIKERNLHEVDLMHEGQYLITFLQPAAPVNHEMIKNLAKKGIIGLTLDGIPRISRAQAMDALTSMSTCAGYKGILLAANELSKFAPQIFCAVGMIPPINTLIVGVGVGGLQALATAKRLGAVVHAADIRPDASEQAKSLGAKVIDTRVPKELAVGEGGYAQALPEDVLKNEREALREVIGGMDIVFLGALVPGRKAPKLVTEDMVSLMAPGSVIVDISIDQGGNCEITEPGKIAVKHGVTIIGIKNIPGMLATSATWMFAHNVYHLLSYLIKDGKMVIDRTDDITGSILTTIDNEVVHQGAKEAMGI
ncbi:MAG: NAD(P) transhydrogenase subunit alpha [Clostridiales bacterium]|nr:NAD(P) transhydrogenase subunit alpha [Clostridiales bacterium]